MITDLRSFLKVSCHAKFRFPEREGQCILGECGPLKSIEALCPEAVVQLIEQKGKGSTKHGTKLFWEPICHGRRGGVSLQCFTNKSLVVSKQCFKLLFPLSQSGGKTTQVGTRIKIDPLCLEKKLCLPKKKLSLKGKL